MKSIAFFNNKGGVSKTTTALNVAYILGQVYKRKVTLDKLLLLVNQPILFSGRIDKNNNSVTITVKSKDKNFLGEILNLQSKQAQLDEQSEKIENRKTYNELKEIAEQSNTKLNYLLVTAEQMKILKENYIQFAYFEKDDKLNIAFLPEKAELIKKLIYPAEKKKSIETPQQKNNRIYAQLKKNKQLLMEKSCRSEQNLPKNNSILLPHRE